MDTPEQDPPEQGYPVSELAEAFRGPTPLEYKTLKDDIDLNGQQVPIAGRTHRKIVDRTAATLVLGPPDPTKDEEQQDPDLLGQAHQEQYPVPEQLRPTGAGPSELSHRSRPGGRTHRSRTHRKSGLNGAWTSPGAGILVFTGLGPTGAGPTMQPSPERTHRSRFSKLLERIYLTSSQPQLAGFRQDPTSQPTVLFGSILNPAAPCPTSVSAVLSLALSHGMGTGTYPRVSIPANGCTCTGSDRDAPASPLDD